MEHKANEDKLKIWLSVFGGICAGVFSSIFCILVLGSIIGLFCAAIPILFLGEFIRKNQNGKA